MKRPEKMVSVRYAKNQFAVVGLSLIIYILTVLYLPLFLIAYFSTLNAQSIFNIFKIPQLFIGILYIIILLGTVMAFGILQYAEKIKFKEFASYCTIRLKDLFIYAIVFIAALFLAIFIISWLNNFIPLGTVTNTFIGMPLSEKYLLTPLYFFLYVLVVPLVEEYAFRGVLLRILGRYGNYFALIIVSILFAVLHCSIASGFVAFFMSNMLIRITLKYHSIQPAIFLHVLFNLLFYAFEFVPAQYSFIITAVILVFYILAVILIILGKFKAVKVRNRYRQLQVVKVFFTGLPIIFSIILVIGYAVVLNFRLI